MKSLHLLALVTLAPLGAAQTELLFAFDRPAGFGPSWGATLAPLADLDGDGVPELAVGVDAHGAARAVSIHSGADGALLFDLLVPPLPMFVGAGIASVARPGTKVVPELVVTGSPSGAPNTPNGWIGVYSGSDGTLLRSFTPPAWIALSQRTPILVLDDLDGDGAEDFLCAVRLDLDGNGGHERPALMAFSSATGAPLYGMPTGPANVVPSATFTGVSDHDGDGVDDFAVFVRVGQTPFVEIRSGANDALLARLSPPFIEQWTNNAEPLISTQDADGDGLRDLAFGGVFSSFVVQLSTVDGSVLREWSPQGISRPRFGSRLIEVGDLDGDGRADLIALESGAFGTDGVSLFGLDPARGAIVFEQPFPGLATGYSGATRIVALPADVTLGFPTFAIHEEAFDRVSVLRYAPELGVRECFALPGPHGTAATLRALGSSELGADRLALEVQGTGAHAFGLFVHGRLAPAGPFANGLRCLTGSPVCLGSDFADATGRLGLRVDATASRLGAGPTTFQAFLRDPGVGRLQATNAVTVVLHD